MTLFELSRWLSPIGGAMGGAFAVHRSMQNSPIFWVVAIPLGIVIGLGCYRAVVFLSLGNHDKNPHLSGWRMGALLGGSLLAPYLAGGLSFALMEVLLCVVMPAH